jgi:hypothetical protein
LFFSSLLEQSLPGDQWLVNEPMTECSLISIAYGLQDCPVPSAILGLVQGYIGGCKNIRLRGRAANRDSRADANRNRDF